MDGKDLEAEIHPLKNEAQKPPEDTGSRAKTEESPRGPSWQPRLSRCRTVAFFLSLFACLLVVFVVSFVIPCPERPASQGVWRIDYNAAVRQTSWTFKAVHVGLCARTALCNHHRCPVTTADADPSLPPPEPLSLCSTSSLSRPIPEASAQVGSCQTCPLCPAKFRDWDALGILGTRSLRAPFLCAGEECASLWSARCSCICVTYDFLATEDINRDRIQDVLFLYKNTDGSNNFNLSCTDEGFSSPCTFVAAVSGANGSVLWERPAAQDGALVQCSVPQLHGGRTSSACVLVGRPGSFVAVDLFTGETLWSHPSSFGRNTSVLSSLLQLPDVDADGAPDLLVLTQEEKEVGGYIYSGSTGRQIGHRGSLGVGGTTGSVLHVTRAGAPYVLFPCAGSLCGCSVKGLHEKATGSGSPLKTDPRWEGALNATRPGLPRRSPGALRYLMNVPGKAGEDLLLVGSEACVLADGRDLAPLWAFPAARVSRKPILGYYKPDALAVVIENGTGVDRQILFLDLSTGAVLWNQALPSLPGDPPSASLPTADHRSAFFFWGLHELTGPNQTEPGDAAHGLYMFHPTLPAVLLELANVSANIVAFQAALFEPSRHAACVLLTGPASPDAPGTVSVAKHKVRDLVLSGRVVRLAEGAPDSDQAVRDRFSRLRYRSEA